MTKVLKLPDVMAVTALSRSSIYAFIKEGSFPKPIPLGARAVGWVFDEIESWLKKRTEMRSTK